MSKAATNEYLEMSEEQREAFRNAPITIMRQDQRKASFGRSGCMSSQRTYRLLEDHRVHRRPAHE